MKPTSTVAEQLQYLKKRHTLYFSSSKINEMQVVALLKVLINRVKQIHDIVGVDDEIKGLDFHSGGVETEEEDVPPKRENLEDIAKDRVQKMYDGVFEVEDSEDD